MTTQSPSRANRDSARFDVSPLDPAPCRPPEAKNAASLGWTVSEPSYSHGGSPRVSVELYRGGDGPDGEQSCCYEPLTIPKQARLELGGPLLQQILSADVEATIRLEAGIHPLPLVENATPIQLEVAPGTVANVRLSMGRDANEKSALRFAQVEFSPPLRIGNLVAAAMASAPLLESLLRRDALSLLKLLPAPLRATLEAAFSSVDIAVGVEIERIGLTEEPARGTRRLVPIFNGSLRMLDTLNVPIDVVPWHKILPSLPTDVEQLAAPLIALFPKLPRGPLAHALSELLIALDAKARVDIWSPTFSVGYRTCDATKRQIDLQLAEPVQIATALRAKRQDGIWRGASESLELSCPSGQASVDLKFEGAFDDPLSTNASCPWARMHLDIKPGTGNRLPPVHVTLWQKNPLLRGEAALELLLERVSMHGAFSFELSPDGLRPILRRDASLSARLNRDHSSLSVELGASQALTHIEGDLQLTLKHRPHGLLWLIDYRGELEHEINAQVTPIAELDLHDGKLRGRARSQSRLRLTPRFKLIDRNATRVDLDGSLFSACIYDFCLELDRRQLTLPGGSELSVRLRRGGLLPKGLQPAAIDLHWDLQNEPCLLHLGSKKTSLLTRELREGELTLHLGESGKLSFSGAREGLYGVRYFNALLNPAGDIGEWLEIFQSDDAIRHVVDAVAMFSEELAEKIRDARALVLTARTILKREGIEEPADLLPRPMIARVLSLFLSGDDRLVDELTPLILHATEGHGIPLAAAKHLVHRELGEFGIDFEIDMLLNWLHLLLRAGDLVEVAVAHEEPPLPLSPEHEKALEGLPSAALIYQWIDEGLSAERAEMLYGLAPELSEAQLAYLLEQGAGSLTPAMRRKFRRVYEIKHRVNKLSEGYGGIEHAMQSFIVGAFIGEAVGPLAGVTGAFAQPAPLPGGSWADSSRAYGTQASDACNCHQPCALGPEDVARLLQIGLGAGATDVRTQLTHHLLLELLKRREPQFTRQVLIELGHQSPRALSGILFAFLEQDQSLVAKPIDLVELLSEKLETKVPRQREFLAGGRRARESYYEALDRLAQQIIANADPYLARKQHLREVRHPAGAPAVIASPHARLEVAAREAIARADSLGNECVFTGRKKGPQQRAKAAYSRAFERCAELLEHEPLAFQLDWFKQFWARNEQALMLLYAVRAHQEDLDDVGAWLAAQTGRCKFRDEQELLAAFASALLYEKSDRARLLADPLTRLLIDPEPARYDYSIITCMGVITEGQDGRELEDSFRRLSQRRGIRVLRSHTGTGRSLEYNARKIVEVIEHCRTPWGIVGYSQGCANALFAEALLHSGTPAQQQLLEKMVCRLLLFSAANGSAHGTRGMSKFSQAMVAGERTLKHYQATMSWEAIRIVLSAFRSMLDSPAFVETLGGGDSLSFERATVLHRDGQFLPHVPTSTVRAIVENDRLPECLEYLYYCLVDMTGGGPQDTQVLATDAVGRATRVANDFTRAMARCDMGSIPLAWHHWAPLTHEVQFVATERDKKLAIYDGPKDCLVWPWVEVNARFGRIKRK
jgi:hypothetical protein